ncbi:MAG: hypothetical protein WD553_00200 [Gemmatimonadaceae bacterium]
MTESVLTSTPRPRWWKWIFIIPPIAGLVIALLVAEPRRRDDLTLLAGS